MTAPSTAQQLSVNHISLGIGEIIVADSSLVVSTVLGSCVAVCIYSIRGNIGAINHFSLPEHPGTEIADADPYRYGDASLKTMIETILASPEIEARDLRAKIIGGAALPGPGVANGDLGALNASIARRLLTFYNINLVAEDTGGTYGRKVMFYLATGKVRVSPVGDAPRLEASSPLPAPSQATPPRRYRVLIVDDSKTMQELLKASFASDPTLEVVGTALNPVEAEKILAHTPVDVMTLDIQMPVMDGVTYLGQLMARRPLPVVMITSMNIEEGDQVLRALELGAVDYIQKPKMAELTTVGQLICEKVRVAATAKVRRTTVVETRTAASLTKAPASTSSRSIVAIGASTGGTEAIKELLSRLPAVIPPIVIVQHIPAIFSKTFADRLNELFPFEVKEAEHNDLLMVGRVLVAPGGLHMSIEPHGMGYKVKLSDDAPVNRHKPSVDVLFNSVAKHVKRKALGVILTGMGADGAAGLLAMKQAGASTLAQDERSCVVFGMPKEAILLGAADQIGDLETLPRMIAKWAKDSR